MPVGYKPKIFSSIARVSRLLKANGLINQSQVPLTGPMIEVALAGYGYALSDPHSDLTEARYFERSLRRYVDQINREITFFKPADPSLENNNDTRTHFPSYVSGKLPSAFKPKKQSWQDCREIQKAIHDLKTCPPRASPTISDPSIRSALLELSNNPTIHLLPADKGGAMVVWKSEDYDREALRQLSCPENYLELSRAEFLYKLASLKREVIAMAKLLHKHHWIASGELKAIRARPLKGCEIYFLPKVHKAFNALSRTFHGRPIAPGPSSLTFPIDKFLAELTAPFLKIIPGVIQDTPDLLLKLKNLGALPPDAELWTCDVVALYPSIDREAGLKAAVDFYSDNYPWLCNHHMSDGKAKPPAPEAFAKMLRLVIMNPYIEFKNKRFYHQSNGTAMGACISVFFAVAYMHSLTKHLIHAPPDILTFFGYYIDDLIFIFKKSDRVAIQKAFDSITDKGPGIKLTSEFLDRTNGGPFLDAHLKLTEGGGFESKPYRKPTSTDSFLHATSGHPPHVIKSIALSQFIRIKRLSSTVEHYEAEAKKLIRSFLARGHSKEDVLAAKARVDAMDRDNLLRNCTDKASRLLASRATTSLDPDVEEGLDTADTTEYLNSYRFVYPYTPTMDVVRFRSRLNALHEAIARFHLQSPSEEERALYAPLFQTRESKLIFANRKLISNAFSAGLKPKNKEPKHGRVTKKYRQKRRNP